MYDFDSKTTAAREHPSKKRKRKSSSRVDNDAQTNITLPDQISYFSCYIYIYSYIKDHLVVFDSLVLLRCFGSHRNLTR
ncbi:hypothetical protein V6N13_086685 [Hibiscus sabdariffa]